MTGSQVDWFVAAGLTAGDGTKERPFHDPWVALKHAAPGDTIHIAAGTYYGRNERSSWLIDCPELTVLGGYSPDFTTRTPWRTPTILAAWPALRTQREPNMLQGNGFDGVTLDGLCFDAAGRSDYDEQGRLQTTPHSDGPIVSLRGERITVRNCVFVNGRAGAVELAGNGCRLENNLILNHLGLGLVTVRDSESQAPITVAGNTLCFAYDDSDPPRGKGADQAIGVRVNGAAVIENNLFVGCGNAAIACYRDVDRVKVDRNLFFLTIRDVIRSRDTSAEAEITEEYLDEIEDVGLQSAAGNTVGDPHLSGLPAAWVDAYTQEIRATYARPPKAALDALRAGAGLGPGPEPEGGGGIVRLTPSEALAIKSEAPQGFHPVELPALSLEAVRTPQPVPAYQPVDWTRLLQADPGLNGAPVEVRAGIGFDQKVELLADAGSATHMGVAVYQPGTDDRALYVLAAHHCLAHRQVGEAIRYQRGLDVESTYLLRGTYRSDLLPEVTRQAVTIVLDSVAPVLDVEARPASRPVGRNWFVRAGASGGDGSRQAPFRDPFQVLEKAEGGDTVHIAGGEYKGRLRSGTWRIPVRNLTLLGGYSDDFTTRDPWRHPVRFVLTPEEKAKGVPSGPVLGTDGGCDGLVLDGLVFDGSTYNAYGDDGGLEARGSLSTPLVDVSAGGDDITVRNCVFINAASSAVHVGGGSGAFENNLVVNTSGTAVRLRTAGAGPWSVRDNTILFAADPTSRASEGHSTSGTLLEINGQAVVRVRSNVLAFADGIAVRAFVPGQNLLFDNNILAANLYADVFDGRHLLIDRAAWDRATIVDSPFGSLAGNRFDLPSLPVDRAFAQPVIDRLASLPAHLPPDLLRAAAGALGVSPTSAQESPAPETAAAPAAAEPGGGASVSDLLADLGRMREEMESKDTKPATVAYCPAYTLDAAVSLVTGTPPGQPGARATAITVSIAEEAAPGPAVEYRSVDHAAIDADPAALDGTPIDLEVTDARSSATNTALYPDGTTRDDYEAFSVTAVGGSTRTRLAVIIRLDTAASRAFANVVPSDTVRVRGVGRLILNGSTLAVVADAVERR
ncbi:MAG TPA: right-handed parallel beta-helix repeat-containing protein [Candidatus Limnocylindrales bacterium]